MTAAPRLQEYPGRHGGSSIRVRGCNFFDPDGTLIELNQMLPAAVPVAVNQPRAVATFEGAPPPNHSTLIVRFPCLANAQAFWYSKEYQERIKRAQGIELISK